MIRRNVIICVVGLILLGELVVQAHFQVLLPSAELLKRPAKIALSLIFTHPMAGGPIMEMGPVTKFGVLVDGKKKDLKATLSSKAVDGKRTYETNYQVSRPGDYVFYLEPGPYWEPAEKKMIIHYTKVVVSAMGTGDGWDAMVGFPVEIEPLVRPYGLWTGNSFRGIVRHNGKPVPFAVVEVEFYNPDRKIAVPDEAFETQVIKADSNGVFSYTMPRAGWWAFSALLDGDKKMKNPAGIDVDVELGGLIWVRTHDMKERKQ